MGILGRADISISSMSTRVPGHSRFRSKGSKGRGGRGMECRQKSRQQGRGSRGVGRTDRRIKEECRQADRVIKIMRQEYVWNMTGTGKGEKRRKRK